MIHQTLLIALEEAYRTAPAHADRLDVVSVGIGASRVKFRLFDTDEGADGRVDRALFAKALGDAARLAAQSVADGRAIASEGFTVAVQRLDVTGPIEAQARVAGVAEDRVVVRALLFGGDGEQVGQLRGLIQLAPAHDESEHDEYAEPIDEGVIRDAESLLDDDPEESTDDDAPSRVPVQTAFVWQTPHGKLFMN